MVQAETPISASTTGAIRLETLSIGPGTYQEVKAVRNLLFTVAQRQRQFITCRTVPVEIAT